MNCRDSLSRGTPCIIPVWIHRQNEAIMELSTKKRLSLYINRRGCVQLRFCWYEVAKNTSLILGIVSGVTFELR